VKKTLISFALLILILLAGVVVRHKWRQRAQREQHARQERDVAYQSALKSYSRILQPGLTREYVENFLRKNGTAFGQVCCIGDSAAFADLVQIGSEKPPWWCSERTVYVAFRFVAAGSHDRWQKNGSDVLDSITIYEQAGGCM
jgi:hypothetical protein